MLSERSCASSMMRVSYLRSCWSPRVSASRIDDGGVASGAVLEADLVADLTPEFDLQFFGDAFGDRGGGDAAWLGAADAFAFRAASHLERDLR